MATVVRIPMSYRDERYEIVLSIGGRRDGMVDLVESESIAAADNFLGDRVLFRNAYWDAESRRLTRGDGFEDRSPLWFLPFVADVLRKTFPVPREDYARIVFSIAA